MGFDMFLICFLVKSLFPTQHLNWISKSACWPLIQDCNRHKPDFSASAQHCLKKTSTQFSAKNSWYWWLQSLFSVSVPLYCFWACDRNIQKLCEPHKFLKDMSVPCFCAGRFFDRCCGCCRWSHQLAVWDAMVVGTAQKMKSATQRERKKSWSLITVVSLILTVLAYRIYMNTITRIVS